MISFSGVWVRLADVEPTRSALLRLGYALPVLALLAWHHRRRRGAGWRTGWMPVALLAGLFFGADLLAWHRSIGIIGAGLGTVIPNLQVVIVGATAVFLFRERPRAWFWLGVPLALVGVFLIGRTGDSVVVGASVGWGVFFGLLTAVFYSAFLLLLRIARTRHPEATVAEVVVHVTLGGTLLTALFAGSEGVLGPPAGLMPNLWLVVLALGSQVLGWILLSAHIHHLPAALTSVALLLQPILAMIWGALILDEPIGFSQVGGAVVVLVGVWMAHDATVKGVTPADLPPPTSAR